MTSVRMPEEVFRAIRRSGLLYPRKPLAKEIQLAFDTHGRNGAHHGALFMAAAHLLGCWIPLLRHAPERLPPDSSILALAATERESGSDLYAMKAFAEPVANGWKLRGEKVFVTNAPLASHFLLVVRTSSAPAARSLSCFLIEREQPGISVRPMPALMGMDGVSIGTLELDNVEVAETAIVGLPGEGASVFRTAMTWERSLILASAPGVLERLLELALAEAAQKHRMGMALSDQPLFRTKAGEVRSAILELRRTIEQAATVLDSGQNAVRISMETKVKSSQLYEGASRTLLQLGGARAYFSGTEVECNLRASLASSIYSGPNEVLELVLDSMKN